MIQMTVNGQKVTVKEGASILEAAHELGIRIPTLCYHKALLPYGACRLCIVEVGEGSKAKVHAACTHPALEGLVVRTDADRIVKMRKLIAELLLARCPEVKAVQKMAAELGVKEARFKPKNSDCILCGLCVRMCAERMGRSAISFVGRGLKRGVQSPFGASAEVCQVCGACDFVCPTGKIVFTKATEKKPIPISSEYNQGLISRPAVFIPYPQAVPNKATIDPRYCVRLISGKCQICKEFCEAGAIDYDQQEKKISLKVGAVILASGYELFNAEKKQEYGYDRYPNVVTALEFERILSSTGPYSGEVLRPSDGRHPRKIAFIQCFGSRDTERNYCSSICCMYATKAAIIAKEHSKESLECHIFYIDIRAYGKGFEEYYERAKKLGVHYIKSKPSSIKEAPITRNLIIQHAGEDGKIQAAEYDLVVLSTGLEPPQSVKELGRKLGVELNEFGFCKTDTFTPVETSTEGIFACGPFTEPKDIPETVMQASGAAAKTLALLASAKGSLIKQTEFPPETDVSGQPPRIGVFICHCGTNIAGVVNVTDVVKYAQTLQDVVYAENNLYTCSNDTQEKIKKLIKEHRLNRVIVASCSPRTHESLFRNTIREAGLNSYLFEMANIRDQCSWVHKNEPEKATVKAKDLVRMAVAKARLLEPLKRRSLRVNKSALVIGAGLSGMTAALELANQAFEVFLVEKEKEPGGNLKRVRQLFNGVNPQGQLQTLVKNVTENKKIHLYTETKVTSVEGVIGSFKSKIVSNGSNPVEFEHGIIIVATGAEEYKPREYLYGESDKVVTQLELEEKLSGRHFKDIKSVVMIQCVGSRDTERGYCSRICCSQAVKNALSIKETNPATDVFILYRDLRTYGFRESYYRKAREKGVIFIKFPDKKKPLVEKNGSEGLKISVEDAALDIPVTVKADLVVLSVATVPYPENQELAQMLKVPLNQEKFFLEAHMKLRPVDFATDGIYLCGLAHSPKTIEESIAQACGAVARASTILSKDIIELEANISQVVDENCDGCAYCVEPCPYKALTLIEYRRNGAIKKTVETNESACKGCGVCMATCPKKGIFVSGFKLEQISAMVDAALTGATA